jgi:hypothetical protein
MQLSFARTRSPVICLWVSLWVLGVGVVGAQPSRNSQAESRVDGATSAISPVVGAQWFMSRRGSPAESACRTSRVARALVSRRKAFEWRNHHRPKGWIKSQIESADMTPGTTPRSRPALHGAPRRLLREIQAQPGCFGCRIAMGPQRGRFFRAATACSLMSRVPDRSLGDTRSQQALSC